MARRLRVEYPGAINHVLNPGDRRELIFKYDRERKAFFEALAAVCVEASWQDHTYGLMPNHFHLVVEPNLVAGMKWFLCTYTGRFNRRHKLFGHQFSGRYKSLLVEGAGRGGDDGGVNCGAAAPGQSELPEPAAAGADAVTPNCQ